MIHLSLSVPTASMIWEAFINYSELQKAHFMPELISFSINDLLKKKMTKTLTHIGSGAAQKQCRDRGRDTSQENSK